MEETPQESQSDSGQNESRNENSERPKRDFNRGPRKSFGGQRRDFGGPRPMHKATCSKCKKECEVPFKPTQDRPVYCKECFMSQRD